MNAITAVTLEVAYRTQDRLAQLPTVTAPTPNFNGPGVEALRTISNVIFAIVLTLAIIGGLIAAGFIVIGHVSSNGRVQKMGITGLVSCVAGVAVAGGVAGLVNWGQSLNVA